MITTSGKHTSHKLSGRAANFLRWLHNDQAGYIEIVAGVVLDPERPDKIIMLMPTREHPDVLNTRKWFYLDPERPDLYAAAGAYAAELAADYGNVYTGIRTYRSKKRAEDNVKPGRVIFIDDAPAAPAIPYSASIRTSEHSRHAYYKCAEPVTKDDARRAQAALGGDPSGVDLTQLLRFPGTVNTKNNGRWSVEPEPSTGPIYNVADLRSAWPSVEVSPKGEITPLAMPAVEKHLANIDELLNCSRSKLIKPDTQTGRILAGEMLSFAVKNRMDDSRSMNGSAVGLGLVLRGFMDDEIAAIVFHLYQKWGVERDKGTEWCKTDIARILAYVHTKHPEVKQSPTRYRQQAAAAPIVSTPARSRARADRPTKFDPPMLFARYQAQPELCDQRRKARASGLGISTATLDRLEDSLEALGLIEIHAPKGMPGKVILLGGVINIPADEVLSAPIEAPAQNPPIEQAQSGENADRSPQCIGETHPPPEAQVSPAARPALPEAVALVLSQVDAREFGRARLKTVRETLAVLYGYTDAARVNLEIKRQESIFAKERRACWAMLPDALFARIEARARSLARNIGNRSEGRYRKLAEIADEVRARRGLAMPERPTRQKPVKPSKGTRGGVCSPNTTPMVFQPDLFADAPPQNPYHIAAMGLADRLRARQAQQ